MARVRRLVLLAALSAAAVVLLGGCTLLRSTATGGMWVWENPRLEGNDLNGVCFSDAQNGWAVGARGTIIHTTNGGAIDPGPGGEVTKTRTEYSGTTKNLRSVAVASTSTAWAVGDAGTIVRTRNGGQTWLPQFPPTADDLNSVCLGGSHVWAVGTRGMIFWTSAGVENWRGGPGLSGVNVTLNAVSFADANHGYAAGGGGTLVKTDNGGGAWMHSHPFPASVEVRGLAFPTPATGYAVTWDGHHGGIWRTVDAGVHWSETTASAAPFASVSASGTAEAWASAADGTAWHTSDSGATWDKRTLSNEALRGTSVAGGSAWVVGSRGAAYSFASGAYTQLSANVTTATLRAYSAAGGRAVGDGGVTVTWSNVFSNLPVTSYLGAANLTAVDFLDSNTGWVTAQNRVLYRFTSGSLAGTSAVPVAPTGVAFTDASNGWLVGNLATGQAMTYHSTDGGSTWATATAWPFNPAPLPISIFFHPLSVAAQGTYVWVVGEAGGSGDLWITHGVDWWGVGYPPGHKPMRAVAAVDKKTVVAVGDAGAIVRSTDGGHTWTVIGSGTTARLNAVTFSGNDGIAVGSGGVIIETTDAGKTWFPHDSGTAEDLFGVSIGGGRGTRAVGAHGTILARVAPPETRSLEGGDRYQTAIAISRSTWATGSAPTVVLATGENWPDAVSGSSLAGAAGGPMLLVHRLSTPAGVVAELKRLGATKAYVLGSGSAVATSVVNEVKAGVGGGFVAKRVYGVDRYETSARIASATVAEIGAHGGSFDHHAFLATGLDWPDALAVSPVAAATHEPVFLTRPNAVPAVIASAAASLDVTGVVGIGGSSVLPSATLDAFAAGLGATTERWSGPDRYETAAEVALRARAERGIDGSDVGLATGFNYPDALTGGVALGHQSGVLLLTPELYLAPADGTYLDSHGITSLSFLGSPRALPMRPRDEAIWTLTSGY